jgi:hypothetical protein
MSSLESRDRGRQAYVSLSIEVFFPFMRPLLPIGEVSVGLFAIRVFERES